MCRNPPGKGFRPLSKHSGLQVEPKGHLRDMHRALRPETHATLSGFNGVVRPGGMPRKFHLHCLDSDEDLTRATVVPWVRMYYLPQDACQPTGACRVKFTATPPRRTR